MESYITIEEQCLEGEIFFRATNMASIPDGYVLEVVDFDIYCNTSEGVPVSVRLLLNCCFNFASNLCSPTVLVIRSQSCVAQKNFKAKLVIQNCFQEFLLCLF